ncbi:uncharacterized protein LOC129911919 isoform X2 [Episyrphus balteatus]|uniref:uncharacterized protein LOC129911919 isoform X2 n=1 Tax=Episyrphus balteatus TaxID=286459 RepID=UPI00248694EC|nr:uncharacterized protein LOC129911919 isoform X2 [Episyrphus balteatus]
MEKNKEFDLIRRKEASAPNLTPVEHFEGPDFICCSEIFKKPKPKLCEGLPNPQPDRKFHCLSKTRPISKPCQLTREINERDILFRPIRWRCNTHKKRNKKIPEPSLGAPIGLSKSSFGMKFLEGKTADQTLQGFATNLVAFAEYFITPEIEWDEKVLNRILLEGQHLYTDSKTKLHDGEKLKESSIKRSFSLCGNAFDLYLNEPFMMGQVIGQEAAVPNLHWGLLKFFKKFQFCLLQIENWYTLLWRNADVYFFFDCFGRRYLDLQIDRKHGVAVLICLRHIENISHLILNLSRVSPEDFFILRNIQVRSLVPCGGEPTPDIVDRSIEFEIISPDYAILRATIHLGSICFKEIRLRHSLPVAFCALINAKIDTTPTWNRAVLDKIIKLGADLYKQWTHCDVSIDLGIHDVPNRFEFGQFLIEIVINAMAECDTWKCTPNYRNSKLSQCLKNAFKNGSNLLVQIQGRTFAIWKKGDYFYILDPYSHQCCLENKKRNTATLHMCGSFDKMCCIFTQALLELFEESKFIIHLVKITRVEELDKIKTNQDRLQISCMSAVTPRIDGAQEVISLNESVIGGDGYVCQAEEEPLESDSADLDSPGLSQTRLDCTDMRRDEESDEETEDEEDDDTDLDSGSDLASERSDESDDEGASRQVAKEKKTKKKAKKSTKEDSEKKNRKEKAESDLSDAETRKRTKKKKDDKKKEGKKSKDDPKKTLFAAEERMKPDNKDTKEDKSKKEKTNKAEIEKKDKEKKTDNTKPKEIEKPSEEPVKEKIPVEESVMTNQIELPIEAEKTIEETINNEVTQEERNEIPEAEPEPVDQDSPNDQRRSKGDTPIERGSTEVPKTSTAPSRRQRHQRRKQQDGEDSSSSDDIPRNRIPVGCIPNSYPGYTEDPQNLAVIGSESGSYESLCNLLKSGFRCADRILTMTPWGNYVAFRSNRTYFVFDGCTCNLRSIRHMDLSVGTAGLLCFRDMHSLINYIEGGRGVRKPTTFSKRDIVDQICSKYCSR